jgi:hypothetical protein
MLAHLTLLQYGHTIIQYILMVLLYKEAQELHLLIQEYTK